MDSVRFGRALGMGARSAAKAVVMAADAAASPRPGGNFSAANAPTLARTKADAAQAAVVQAKVQARATQQGLVRGGRRFTETAWGPFVRLSGVLWLELTGVFFGLFLLTAIVSAWRLRANLHDLGVNHIDHERLLWSVAMALVFGYFCLSSFVRAARRERGKR